MPTVRSGFRTMLVAAVLSLVAAGCGENITGDDPELPFALAVRSDTPYIRGTIVERFEPPMGGVGLLIRASDPEARTPSAVVKVASGAILVWPDGSSASVRDLRVGQEVVAWSNGVELRSLPPQTVGEAFLLLR